MSTTQRPKEADSCPEVFSLTWSQVCSMLWDQTKRSEDSSIQTTTFQLRMELETTGLRATWTRELRSSRTRSIRLGSRLSFAMLWVLSKSCILCQEELDQDSGHSFLTSCLKNTLTSLPSTTPSSQDHLTEVHQMSLLNLTMQSLPWTPWLSHPRLVSPSRILLCIGSVRKTSRSQIQLLAT